LVQLREVHWMLSVHALPRPLPEQRPLVQLPESHWVLSEHASPTPVPRQQPPVQLPESHWTLSEQRAPTLRLRQYPSVQLLLAHWVLSVQAAPRALEQLEPLPDEPQSPSRPVSRVHAEGSGRELAARSKHESRQVKSPGSHAEVQPARSKPEHCTNAVLVAQA
jgi:hypothetical protein